jgi:transcriptional regulator with XRE-family HTH domain
MNEIGKKIKELRKKKGLSQEELAEFSKVNLRTIQRIENDENEPRGKTLNLICEALDVNA